MPSQWITFLKEYSKKNNISYACAMTDKKAREEYSKLPKVKKRSRGKIIADMSKYRGIIGRVKKDIQFERNKPKERQDDDKIKKLIDEGKKAQEKLNLVLKELKEN